MKNHWILILAILAMGMFPQIALSDSVHVKGRWGDNIIRSIFPQAPEVSVDGNVLSIHCIDALSDLTVTVTDAEGNVILEECVTVAAGETIDFVLDGEAGSYRVTLTHACGNLQGEFDLN